MIIEDGRLIKVEESDIVDGTCKIPEGVTDIGDESFNGCIKLHTITLPDSLSHIGKYAFAWCRRLKSITIPERVTSIGDYAFQGCERLKSITIPERVTSIGDYAFDGCESLESIDIPESVTDIGRYAFRDCERLKSITIPERVTSINSCAFRNCKSLKSIDIPESVTSIGRSAFWECERLKSITIPESVTSINSCAFYDCKSLETVVLPQSVDDYEDVFVDCNNLRTVMFRDKVPESLVKDGALTDKAVACFGPDVTITVVSSSKKSVEKEKITEKSSEKTAKQTSDKSNSVTSNKKAVVQMKESSIHPLPNYPGRSYANIGLNSEHGTYGYICFLDKFVKTPRSNPDIRLLYLNPSKEYNVAFSNPDTGNWEYHNMTGREISDGNKAYLKERGLVKDAVMERPLPSVADNMQAPQSDMQFE